MLTQEDKNKIMELRSQDFSYQAIHDRLGFAIDTVMKVYNEEKERKAKELGEGKSGKVEEGQIKRDVVSFGSAIPEVHKIESDVDNVIKSGKLKAGDKREWEKRKEDIRAMLREEVDDVRATAFEARDGKWREFLEQNYVKKEVATNLSNTIQGKDLEIRNLKAAIKERDNLLSENQSEMSQVKVSHNFEKENLGDQIRSLLRENNFLKEENVRQHNYIENRLDRDVRQWQGQVYHDQEVLNNKKIKFDRHVKAQQTELNEMFIELDKKGKDVERCEKELAEKKDKFRKREDEFYKTREILCEDVRKIISERKEKYG